VPARPESAPDFVPVGDTPPPRDLKTLTEAERKKLEADLVTMRDRQEGKTPHPQAQTSHSQEKRTPSAPANTNVTDQAANR
jgi:hypothetical protein